MSAVKVRRATPSDAEAVWALTCELATSFTPERAAFERSYAQLIEASTTLLLVAEREGGVVVGYLLASRTPVLHAVGPVVTVEELVVDTAARRQGVGAALMAAAEQWAAGAEASYVALATRRAGAFYVAVGYEESAAYLRKRLR